MSPGRRRRLVRSVLLLVLVLVAGGVWLRDRREAAPPPAPVPAAARPAARDAAGAATRAERPPEQRTWRLRVTTHPPGALLSIRPAGGPARRARTPFRGTVAGGELELAVAKTGYNRLVQRLPLDRHRSPDLWLDPAGLLHHKLGELRSGSNPKQVAFSPDGRELWVSLLGGHGVEVFDTRTMRRRKAIRLGKHGAVEVLFTRDGRTVYASQMETASVWEIDRHSFRVRRQLPTKGNWSKVMALSPDERTLYVANWVSSDVSEIDLRKGRVRRLLKTVACRAACGRPPTAACTWPGSRTASCSGSTWPAGRPGRCCAPAGPCATWSATPTAGACTLTTWAPTRRSWSTWPASGSARWPAPTTCPTPST